MLRTHICKMPRARARRNHVDRCEMYANHVDGCETYRENYRN